MELLTKVTQGNFDPWMVDKKLWARTRVQVISYNLPLTVYILRYISMLYEEILSHFIKERALFVLDLVVF